MHPVVLPVVALEAAVATAVVQVELAPALVVKVEVLVALVSATVKHCRWHGSSHHYRHQSLPQAPCSSHPHQVQPVSVPMRWDRRALEQQS